MLPDYGIVPDNGEIIERAVLDFQRVQAQSVTKYHRILAVRVSLYKNCEIFCQSERSKQKKNKFPFSITKLMQQRKCQCRKNQND